MLKLIKQDFKIVNAKIFSILDKNALNLPMYVLEHNPRFLNDDMVYITQREFEGLSMMTWFIFTRKVKKC